MNVYKITNIKSEKRYIGITLNNPNKRFKRHLYNLRSNNHKNPHLQRSFNKYGENSFKFEVLEECDCVQELNEREKYWIEKCGDYNIRLGGKSGGKLSQETKNKLRKIVENNQARTVHKYSLKGDYIESYNSLSEAARCNNLKSYSGISKTCEGKYRKSGGYQWSYEKKDNIGKISKTKNKKDVIKLTKNNKKIDKYKSVSKAAQDNNILITSLHNCLSGISNTSGGFKWEYK